MNQKLHFKFPIVLLCLFLTFNFYTQNLLNTSSWTVGSGSVSGYSQYGDTSENSRLNGEDHLGNNLILWKASPDDDGGQSGGFASSYINIDHTKNYRLSVWIKKTNSSDGTTYFKLTSYSGGIHHTLKLDGSTKSYPAFWSGDLPKLDRWYLFVGFIHNSSHSSTVNQGKLYDGVTGEVVQSITDYKFNSTATRLQHRAFLAHDTNTLDKQYMHSPRMEVAEGGEWPINLLLGLNPDSTLQFEYDNSGNQKQRYYCPTANCNIPTPPAGRSAPQEIEEPNDEDNTLLIENEVLIYPNPTKGLTSLKFNSNSEISITGDIHVFNSAGILALTTQSKSKNEIELDLTSLPTGMYLIHIHFSNGTSTTKQIIKK